MKLLYYFGIASSLSKIKKKIQDLAKIGLVGLVETRHIFFSALSFFIIFDLNKLSWSQYPQMCCVAPSDSQNTVLETSHWRSSYYKGFGKTMAR